MSAQLPPAFDVAGRLFLDDPRVHGPLTPAMLAAVKAWAWQESGGIIRRNNPWNLHSPGGLPGQIGSDYVGPGDTDVAVFDSLAHGVQAAVGNLVRAWAPAERIQYGYDHVLAAAREGDAPGFLAALARSAWSAGRYGTRNGGPNVLVGLWKRLGGWIPMALSPEETNVRTIAGYVVTLLDHKLEGTGWTEQDAKSLASDLATLQRDLSALIDSAPASDPAPAAAQASADSAPASDPAPAAAQASAAYKAAHPEAGMDWEPVFEPGAVDLSRPSGDTYRLLQQWVHANLYPGEAVTGGSVFTQSTEVGPQIAQLSGQIIGQGAAYWAAYPPIPSSVLAMGGPGVFDAAKREHAATASSYIRLGWVTSELAALFE